MGKKNFALVSCNKIAEAANLQRKGKFWLMVLEAQSPNGKVQVLGMVRGPRQVAECVHRKDHMQARKQR